jgi:hypothetical protein
MKRGEHLFQFTGKQIAAAAMEEHDYHAERWKWWRDEEDAAIKQAKASGIEVREMPVTGGRQVQVVIDPTVQARLTQCGYKISGHKQAADRFQIEAGAYQTQPERSFELQPDDVLYFRLAGGPREE